MKKKAKPRIWELLLAEHMETRSKELLDGHSDDALGQPGTALSSPHYGWTVLLAPKKSHFQLQDLGFHS